MTRHVPTFPHVRLRRMRQHPKMRDLIRETQLQVTDFIQPLFVRYGHGEKRPIVSMPGMFQFSVDQLGPVIDDIKALGIPSVMLFGIPEHKDDVGSSALSQNGVVQEAARAIKKQAPELLVSADLCFCEYTDHGHCGVVNDATGRMDVDNDATLKLLAEQAVSLAQAGVDLFAPSGNIDGMVRAVREGLDLAGFQHVPILVHSVKYASSLYGPFRDAAEGAPQFGDRQGYQLDIANGNEALREVQQDIIEGADIVMVKPASAYMDIISRIKHRHQQPPPQSTRLLKQNLKISPCLRLHSLFYSPPKVT